MPTTAISIKWKKKLDKKKVDNSMEYLQLIFKGDQLKKIEKELSKKNAKLESFEAKNLLRASGLNPLTPTDSKVAEKTERILEGKQLDPVIIIGIDNRLFIADGYHHICACYNLAEDTLVKCRHIII
jgi:hypothetical protein